jgi:hypothetical protein
MDRLHAQALVKTADASVLGEDLVHAFAGTWQASAGQLIPGGATVDVQAWPDGLRLDAYAATQSELEAAESAVNAALDRLRAGAAAWTTRPSTVPGAPPVTPPVYTFPFDDDEE